MGLCDPAHFIGRELLPYDFQVFILNTRFSLAKFSSSSSSQRERIFYKPFEEKFVPSIGSQREWQKTATFSYLFLLLNRKQKICPAKISSQVVATEKAQKGQ